jgi:metal-dependent amidase/aminoacylase/carboxypeptidase family protein
MHGEVTEWRRDLHANPELLYDVHRTAASVAEKLRAFGCDETITGIGKSGVVGIIKGRANSSGRTIGLRADMDALPMQEETGLPYASKIALEATEVAPEELHDSHIRIHCSEGFAILVTPRTQMDAAAGQDHTGGHGCAIL